MKISKHPRFKEYTTGIIISIVFFLLNYYKIKPFTFSTIEVLGFITGAWSVWLLARNSMWNWPIGIINGALFVYLFYDAKLFADAGINMWYVLAGIYGWLYWLKGGKGKTHAPITHILKWEIVVVVLAIAIGLPIMASHLKDLDDPNPWIDGFTAMGSMAAYWLQSRKRFEAWYIWIIVDVFYIPLYFIRDLPLTGILYIIFMTMCFIGLNEWRKLLKQQKEQTHAA